MSKKVLSLVLAVVLAFGMMSVAFAADTGKISGTGWAVTVDGFSVNRGATAKTAKFDITPSTTTNATATTGDIAASTITGDDSDGFNLDLKDLGLSASLQVRNVAGTTTVTSAQAYLSVTAKSNAATGTYNNVVMTFGGAIVTVKSLTVTSSGSIPAGAKITGISATGAARFQNFGGSMVPQKVEAKNEYTIQLFASDFTWEKDKAVLDSSSFASSRPSSSHLNNVTVRRVYQKGTGGTIRDVELLTGSNPRVRIRFVEYYTKTVATDVEMKLALCYQGVASPAAYEFVTKIENGEQYIDEGQTDCYSDGNIYHKAEATVRNVEFEGLNDIVFATKTVVSGQKYYFRATDKLSTADSNLLDKNPEIDSIYTIYQNNMANATVQFKNLDAEYFVYNQDGVLLGTTKDAKLPLASQYILTTAKVDFGGNSVDETPASESEAPAVSDPETPAGGGDGAGSSNANYNPNTGL